MDDLNAQTLQRAIENHPCHRSNIRPDQVEELNRYAREGYPLNECLRAVVANDLMGALGQADDDNMRAMPALAAFVYNDMPGICHGSYKVYRAWLAVHQAVRDGLKEEEINALADKVQDARKEAEEWKRDD